ncbi:MAG: hypothetical protein M0Z55_04170 [Peptococcaceae bacterium]|nr:hypothetical protein [Peptococcaceae bacterium]
MNRSPWGRRRNNDLMHDLQALALWIIIIGIIGYLLFPGFFQDVYNRLKLVDLSAPAPVTEQTTLTTQPQVDFPAVFQQVYGSGQMPELSKGYWAIFVRDGQFEQLPLSEQAYAFVCSVIEKDSGDGKQKLILTTNGQVQQVMISEEAYAIICQLAIINDRNPTP